jgi:hypothetical protein
MKRFTAILITLALAVSAHGATLSKTSKVGETTVQWERTDAGATQVLLTKQYKTLGGRWASATTQTINIGAGLQSGNIPGGPFIEGHHRISVYFDDSAGTTESAAIEFRTFGWTSLPLSQIPADSPLPAFMTAMADQAYVRETFPASPDALTTTVAVSREVQIMLLRIGHRVAATNQSASPAQLARLICQEIDLTDFQTKYGLASDINASDRALLLGYCGWTAKTFLLSKKAAEVARINAERIALGGVNVTKMKELK